MGYQAQDLKGINAASIGATFANVADNGKVRLGDIVANGFVWDKETLQVLDTTDAHTVAKYSYVTAEKALDDFEDETMKGWWTKGKEGEDDKYRADEVMVDVGHGFLGSFGKTSVEMQYSGQVLQGSSELDLTGLNAVMAVNFLPIDIMLGDVVADGFVYDKETLQELDTGDAHTINKYSYVTAEKAIDDFEDETMKGWWIKGKEGEDDKYRADSKSWGAGKAFLSSFGKLKVKMVFPDPMNYKPYNAE